MLIPELKKERTSFRGKDDRLLEFALRIAMQWLYAVESHLLGFVERSKGRATEKEIAGVVESQARELIQIEKYYTRAGEKAARIVYFWGMILGVGVSALLMLGIAGALWATGWFEQPHTREVETFFVSFIAGGVGAIVSVLMRMSSNRFRVDFEVGRATVRRLGSFRPFIGAVFGMALYFLRAVLCLYALGWVDNSRS